MSIFFSVLRTAQVFAICLILTACSGSPSIGEQMVEQSGAMKAVGEDWLDGEDRISEGKALMKESEAIFKKRQAGL